MIFPLNFYPIYLKGLANLAPTKSPLQGESRTYTPQFEALVQTIVEAGCSLSIVSNGQQTLPYNPILEKLGDRLTCMFLSLDGVTPQTHDTIRGKVGAFERTKGAIRHYIGRGVKVQTTTCLNRLNKHELDEIVRAGLDLGISGMRFAGVIPAPWNQQLLLSDTEKLELYQHICHLNKETPIPLLPTSALYTSSGISFCDVLNLRALYFNPRGEMIFCCDTRGQDAVIGSLEISPLNSLIEK